MATANDLNISQAGYVVFDGIATFTGRTFQAGAGITLSNADGTAGNTTISASGAATAVQHLTADTGGQLNPDGSNNFTLSGQAAGSTTVFDTIGSGSTIKFEDRSWLTPFVVDPSATVGLRGTFQTISAALTAASSGQTIFIRDGSYTENPTLKAGVNLCTFASSSTLDKNSSQFNVKIIGKLTATFSGTCAISGICLQTNSDFALVVSGTNDTYIDLNGCFINATNSTSISLTSTGSSTGSKINLNYSYGNLGATGAYFSASSGGISFFGGQYSNQGGSTTASTLSGGAVDMTGTTFNSFITTTSSSGVNLVSTNFGQSGQTSISLTGTSTLGADLCKLTAGTASCVSVGAGCSATVYNSEASSSNTNVFTGAGTIAYGLVSFISSSSTVNTTTKNPIALTAFQGGTGLTAAGTSGNVLTSNGTIWTSSAPAGNIAGPGSSTDRAISTWNGTGGTALFNNSTVIIDSSGRLLNTTQPTFSAYISTSPSNVTGDATLYTIPYDSTNWNVGSMFNTSTGLMTAPVTGTYQFNGVIYIQSLGAAHLTLNALFTNGYYFEICNPFVQAVAGVYMFNFSKQIQLAANATLGVSFLVSGGTKTVGILGGAHINEFTGWLLG